MAKLELIKKKMLACKAAKDKEGFTKFKAQYDELKAKEVEVETEEVPVVKKKVKTVEDKPKSKKKAPVVLRSPEVIVETITALFKANCDETGKLKFNLDEFDMICKGSPDEELVGDVERLLMDEKIHCDVIEDTLVLSKLNVYKKAKKLSKSVLNKALKELEASEVENAE